MTDREKSTATDVGSKPTPKTEEPNDGVVAKQPWPDQEARRMMSAPHPRKREANRDFAFLPRGSLATD